MAGDIFISYRSSEAAAVGQLYDGLILVGGFDSRPVIYYHFNKPYYAGLAEACGYRTVMHYPSWECAVQENRLDPAFGSACEKLIARSGITISRMDSCRPPIETVAS